MDSTSMSGEAGGGMTDLDAPTPEESVSRRSALRGAALGAVAVGAAGAGIMALAGRASAAVTLPSNPSQVTTADAQILRFLCSLARAAEVAYTAAATSLLASDKADVLKVFANHHTQAAAAYGALAGKVAPTKPNANLLSVTNLLITGAPNQKAMFAALRDLEDGLNASALSALGDLVGTDGSERVGSTLASGVRRVAVLGQLAGKDSTTAAASFLNTAAAFDPAKYPVE